MGEKRGKVQLILPVLALLAGVLFTAAALVAVNEPEPKPVSELGPYFDTIVVLDGVEYWTTEEELDDLLRSLGVGTEYVTPDNGGTKR